MCDLKGDFKLCSCDGDKLPIEKVDWILERKNHEIPARFLKGSAARNFIDGHKKHIQSLIATELNKRNCFDFKYSPNKDDLLKIKQREIGPIRWYNFRFINGQWTKDNSTAFDAWRSQHEYYKNGKNHKNINELFEKEAKSMLTKKDLEEMTKRSNDMFRMLDQLSDKKD